MRPDRELIAEILEAADELAILVARGRDRYDADFEPRRTTERLIEIIGEAAGRLSAELKGRRPDLPLRQARATRNFIVHEYERVDYDLLWQIAAEEVPQLAAGLKDELERLGQGSGAGTTRRTDILPESSQQWEMPAIRLCGAPTDSGQPCQHEQPQPGGKCPAGHLGQ